MLFYIRGYHRGKHPQDYDMALADNLVEAQECYARYVNDAKYRRVSMSVVTHEQKLKDTD